MRVLQGINWFYGKMFSLMIGLAGIALMFIVLSISFSVVMRYFFRAPIFWVIEVSTYILLYITLICAPWILQQGLHISIDVVSNKFKGRIKQAVNFITSMTGAVLFFLLGYHAAIATWRFYIGKYFTDTMLEIPRSILVGIVFISCLFLFIEFTISAVKAILPDKSVAAVKKLHDSMV